MKNAVWGMVVALLLQTIPVRAIEVTGSGPLSFASVPVGVLIERLRSLAADGISHDDMVEYTALLKELDVRGLKRDTLAAGLRLPSFFLPAPSGPADVTPGTRPGAEDKAPSLAQRFATSVADATNCDEVREFVGGAQSARAPWTVTVRSVGASREAALSEFAAKGCTGALEDAHEKCIQIGGRTDRFSGYQETPTADGRHSVTSGYTCKEEDPKDVAMVYQQWGTTIRIEIVADGLTLTDADKENIRGLLARVPPEHLAGLNRITLRPGFSGVYYDFPRGMADVQVHPNGGNPVAAVSLALGNHAYWKFGNALRELAHGPDLFAYYYSNYLWHSAEHVWGSAEFADKRGVEIWLEQQGFSTEGAEGRPEDLQTNLAISAMFQSPQSLLTRQYVGFGEMSYADFYRQGNELVVGELRFAIEGDMLVGVTKGPLRLGQPPIEFRRWAPPVKIPRLVLDRIQTKN